MLCSLPTTAKSSQWLHRLRTSRGFPDSDHIDLEHFLSDPTNHTPLPPEDNFAPETSDDDNGAALQGRDLVNNVLSDLFYMGDDTSTSKRNKKSCRKQHCPRICLVSDAPPLTLTGKHNKINEHVVVEEEEERGRCDLSAYSQTEVTVIDTSVPCWKFEKVLYRSSKNTWKVGDKKGLMSNADRNKRKERVNENVSDMLHSNKLKKKMKSFKYVVAAKEEAMVVSKSHPTGHDQGKIVVVTNEKKRDNSSQLQEKSFCKKQINEGSSVILIKSIPTTNKKNVSGVSNGCVKSMQR